MTHVLTSSRLAFTKPLPRPWSDYAPYLSWVQTDPQYAAGARNAGIKPYLYTNPNRQMPGQNMYTSDESTFSHDCNGGRIHYTQIWQVELMEPSSANLAQLWLAVSQKMRIRSYAAIFEDDTSDVYGVNALPCGYDANAWLTNSIAEAGVLSATGIPVVYNGLSLLGPGPSISPVIAMNQVSIGGMMENCYIRPGTSNNYTNGKGWAVVEDTEITMGTQHKYFWCYANDYNLNAGQAIALRTYAYASFLLSYRPWWSIYENNFANMNDFNVMPETMIVPLQPRTWAPRSSSDLLTSTGAYGRQYASCTLHGQAVGPCAAVVNADAFHSHAFPYSGYHHTMMISGGDILSGGTVATNGPAPPSSLAPLTALVVFQ